MNKSNIAGLILISALIAFYFNLAPVVVTEVKEKTESEYQKERDAEEKTCQHKNKKSLLTVVDGCEVFEVTSFYYRSDNPKFPGECNAGRSFLFTKCSGQLTYNCGKNCQETSITENSSELGKKN